MLIRDESGKYMAGMFDVLVLLFNVKTQRYHPAVAIEHPMPGPPKPIDEITVVRLRSFAHHTEGRAELEAALALIDEMRDQLGVHEENVARVPVLWDGEQFRWIIGNWYRLDRKFEDVFCEQVVTKSAV